MNEDKKPCVECGELTHWQSNPPEKQLEYRCLKCFTKKVIDNPKGPWK